MQQMKVAAILHDDSEVRVGSIANGDGGQVVRRITEQGGIFTLDGKTVGRHGRFIPIGNIKAIEWWWEEDGIVYDTRRD